MSSEPYNIDYMGQFVGAPKSAYNFGLWLIRDAAKARKEMPDLFDDKGRCIANIVKQEDGYHISLKKHSGNGLPLPNISASNPASAMLIQAYGMYLALDPSLIAYIGLSLFNSNVGDNLNVVFTNVKKDGFGVKPDYNKDVIYVYPFTKWDGDLVIA